MHTFPEVALRYVSIVLVVEYVLVAGCDDTGHTGETATAYFDVFSVECCVELL